MFLALLLAAFIVAVLIARRRFWPAPSGDGVSTGDLAFLGVRFFSAIAGIAIALAGVLFVSSAGGGWTVALSLAAGVGLIVVSEFLVGKHPVTANALAGAGIAILYAAFYAWKLAGLLGVLLVTAAAVWLSIRRHSFFIALVGLVGGFAMPALLGSMDNPYILFGYLLLLNVGIAVVAVRENWPVLTLLALIPTTLYQWVWVIQSMRVRQLPLGAAIFLVFFFAGTAALWLGWPRAFRKIAAAAAILPLGLAFYLASQPDYGLQVHALFGYLFLLTAGLLYLAWRSGWWWLHLAGGVATLVTWGIWVDQSYSSLVWPRPLLWLALFIVLYTVRLTFIAPLLFAVCIVFAEREKTHEGLLITVMLALIALVVFEAIRKQRPYTGALAVALASIAVMVAHPALTWLVLAHALLFAALFLIAWTCERPLLALLAIPFYVAMVITAHTPATAKQQFLVAVVPFALFVLYAFVSRARLAAIAAVLAALVFFLAAFPGLPAGLVLIAIAIVLFLLARSLENAIVLNAALFALSTALPLLFVKEAVVILWALEAVALLWLYLANDRRTFLLWSIGLASAAFFWVAIDSDFYARRLVWMAVVAILFAGAWISRHEWPGVTLFYSLAGLVLGWFRVNVEIANYYHSTLGAAPFEFRDVSAREDVTYTIAWAVIATGLLFIGLKWNWRGGRVGAISLLLATIAKCFLHDLTWLEGTYRLVSLIVLALCLALVGLVLQKYVTPESRHLADAV